jgi:hypothetical protein
MFSRARKAVYAAVVLTASLALPAFADKAPKPPPRQILPGPPPLPPAARKGDSEREAAVRKAQSEIQKNPTQKKFILFRYGLHEEDLR